jgi:hypothetical protein
LPQYAQLFVRARKTDRNLVIKYQRGNKKHLAFYIIQLIKGHSLFAANNIICNEEKNAKDPTYV